MSEWTKERIEKWITKLSKLDQRDHTEINFLSVLYEIELLQSENEKLKKELKEVKG